MRFDIRDGGRTIVVKLTLRRSDGNKSVGGMVVIKKSSTLLNNTMDIFVFLDLKKRFDFLHFLIKGGIQRVLSTERKYTKEQKRQRLKDKLNQPWCSPHPP